MASMMATVPDSLKGDLEHFRWINWSEVSREELNKSLEWFEKVAKMQKIAESSKLTEEDADALSDKLKLAILQRRQKKGARR